MNCAIIFCGHIRSWDLCKESLHRYILDPLKPDVFAITFDTIGYNTHDGRDWSIASDSAIESFKKSTNCKFLKVIKNEVEDEGWMFGHSHILEWSKNHDRVKIPHLRLPNVKTATAIQGAVGMFRTWNLGIEEFGDELSKYDLLIRCRFDLKFNNDINFVSPAHDELVVPNFCAFHKTGGCNDQFFYGQTDAVLRAMSIYKHLKKYCLEDDVNLHPETIFGHHLSREMIRKHFVELDFVILRKDGRAHDLRKAKS